MGDHDQAFAQGGDRGVEVVVVTPVGADQSVLVLGFGAVGLEIGAVPQVQPGVLVRGVLVVTLGVLVLEFFPRGVDETRVGEQGRTAVVGAPPVVRGGAFGRSEERRVGN